MGTMNLLLLATKVEAVDQPSHMFTNLDHLRPMQGILTTSKHFYDRQHDVASRPCLSFMTDENSERVQLYNACSQNRALLGHVNELGTILKQRSLIHLSC